MDFIKGPPLYEGTNYIQVVVDCLRKYGYFLNPRHPFSASLVATLFIREILHLHGLPKSIVSNRDKIFMRTFGSPSLKVRVLLLQ